MFNKHASIKFDRYWFCFHYGKFLWMILLQKNIEFVFHLCPLKMFKISTNAAFSFFLMCTNKVLWNTLTMKDSDLLHPQNGKITEQRPKSRALLVHYRLLYFLSACFLESPCTDGCIAYCYSHNIAFYRLRGCTRHSRVIFLFYSYYPRYDKRSICKPLPLPIHWISMMLFSNLSTRLDLIMALVHYPECLWLIVH